MLNEKKNYYWHRFLKSGSITDYLNYRKFKKALEAQNEPNTKSTGNNNQED